jgi:hypothetical protein
MGAYAATAWQDESILLNDFVPPAPLDFSRIMSAHFPGLCQTCLWHSGRWSSGSRHEALGEVCDRDEIPAQSRNCK